VLDSSFDDLRESYRRIDLIFPSTPSELDFRLIGVEDCRTRGHQISLLASASVITSKPAIRYQFKTGQRDRPKT
jgi:hypothetical protein